MEEDRTFSGAFARLFGLILAIVLFILAIWFVVRLVGEITSSTDTTTENGVVVTVDDDESVIDKRVGDSDENTAVVLDDSTDETEVLAANTGELPNTGAESYILGLFTIALAIYMAKQARISKENLSLV